MMNNRLNIANRFLEKLFSFEGIETQTLQFKKTYGTVLIVVTVFILLMFIPAIHYQVQSLLLYGILLLGWYIPFLIIFVLLKRKLVWLVHVSQHMAIFVTFYIIFKIGGIHECGGIIFAALNAVVFTVLLFNSLAWFVWYFILFCICLLTVGFLQFTFKLPPEMTPEINHLFYSLNTLFISCLTFVVVVVYLKQYIKTEKEKADKLLELDRAKTRLYTNITHEFRTPLTVISGAADLIEMQKGKGYAESITKIRRNTENLLHLVNQMLDLSKLEAGALSVNSIQTDIIEFVKYLCESFRIIARKKSIEFSFQTHLTSFYMDFDPDKLTQILSNLISNAIKYTPNGGLVELNAAVNDRSNLFILHVKDNGVGIPENKCGQIFDRFFRVDHPDENQPESTGLGLSITKELVKLLKGTISVKSELGIGTDFLITFPVTKKATVENDTEKQKISFKSFSHFRNVNPVIEPYGKSKTNYPFVLIVEDNSDVVDYLCSILSGKYKISIARNGNEGLSQALEIIPDIMISDIMMPKMDGITMLQQLKSDIRTNHIPVILLTARADFESKLEGISVGADAYLAKPFKKEELFVQLTSLLEIRKRLQEKYSSISSGIFINNKSQVTDDSFIIKLHETFNKNIADENFGISEICEIMHMSRTQLYRKFKALTNYSVKDYLRSYRLQKARQLLLESHLNVSQVAFMVGFKNLSHFSKSFFDVFDINPSELKH